MGRRSHIDILPPQARAELQAWLADPAVSQEEATEALHALLDSIDWDGPRPSRHSVNRYAQRFSQIMQRRAEANEVAQHWVAQFGRVPQGQLGQLVIQMIQGMAFDNMVQLDGAPVDPEDMPAQVRMLRDLAAMAERTERAASLNAERERTIRRDTAEQLAQAAEKEGGTVTAERLRDLVREVYGA